MVTRLVQNLVQEEAYDRAITILCELRLILTDSEFVQKRTIR